METSISLYENLTLIFGIAGVVMLVVSFALYIAFDIRQIISKRLGLTEKKALRQMQMDAKAAERKPKPMRKTHGAAKTASEQENEKVSDKTSQSEKMETGAKISGNQDDATMKLEQMPDSDMQFSAAPDGLELEETANTIVLNEEQETAVLSGGSPEVKNMQFMLVKHIMLIHTDEVI